MNKYNERIFTRSCACVNPIFVIFTGCHIYYKLIKCLINYKSLTNILPAIINASPNNISSYAILSKILKLANNKKKFKNFYHFFPILVKICVHWQQCLSHTLVNVMNVKEMSYVNV